MGLTSSPYFRIKGLLIALEFVRGHRCCKSNPFRWDRLEINLPGDPGYDPRRSKLSRLSEGHLAALIITYVDDMRAAAGGEQACWHIMHVVSTRLAYLGIQVALRKTRPPAKQPGPWAGSMVISDSIGVGVKATCEKWLKVKGQLKQTLQWIDSGAPINRNDLESI
jgi:hypothetical protein